MSDLDHYLQQWASGYEAYDRLSPAFQRFLEGLTAVHNADFFNEVYARSIFYVL